MSMVVLSLETGRIDAFSAPVTKIEIAMRNGIGREGFDSRCWEGTARRGGSV